MGAKTWEIPSVLKPENVTMIIDTREQLPLALKPFRTVVKTLPTGDYSVAGLEEVVAVERKSLPDLLGCIGQHRERFVRELQRLRAYRFAAVVVEASWDMLELGMWRSQVRPQAVIGSVLAWSGRYCPFILVGSRKGAEKAATGFLWHAARQCHREIGSFIERT